MKTAELGFSFLLLLFAVQHCVATVTKDDLVEIKCAVFHLADNYKGDGPQPMLGKMVRLVFHDCIGGCDGHVDLKQKGTEGLNIPIFHLEQIYAAKFAPRMSRADFWAAAGTMAILKGSLNAGKTLPKLKFFFGRKDAPPGPEKSAVSLPNAYGGIQDVTSFCHKSFGLEVGHTVALMGAHTLGRANKRFSGFDGAWVDTSANFDNSYFVGLVRHKGWQLHKTSWGVNQWEQVDGQPNLMCMNADIALYKDIGNPSLADGSGLTCTATSKCKPQRQAVTGMKGAKTTAELIDLYARDNDRFYNDFAQGFHSMIQTGAPKEGLKEVVYDVDHQCCCDMVCPPVAAGKEVKTPIKAAVAGKAVPEAPCQPLYAFPAGSLGLEGAAKTTHKPPVGLLVGAAVGGVMVISGAIFGHLWLRTRYVSKDAKCASTAEKETGVGTGQELQPVPVAQIVFDQRESKN